MTGQQVSAHPSTAVSLRDVLSLATFVIGFVLGLLQPLVAVAVGVGLVAGPTLAGLALALGIGLFVPSLVLVWLFRTGRGLSVPLAMLSGTLALGVMGGTVLGAVLQVPTRTRPPVTYVPAAGMPSFPVVLDAPGAVSLRLDDAPGFTPAASEPVDGGLFGHWCSSAPGTKDVAHVEGELGTLGDRALVGTVSLEAGSLTSAHVVLLLRGVGDESWTAWSGAGTVSDRDATMGRVTFASLTADPLPTAAPVSLTGEIAWTCGDWRR